MVYLISEDADPSLRLSYAAELANACNLPWTMVQGSNAVKKTVPEIPDSYDFSSCKHKSPLQAYRELKQVLPADTDPLCFIPCPFCSNPCAGAHAAGEALDKGHVEATLLSYIVMNFDLLVPDFESLKKSTTREWFFSLFKLRRYYASVSGQPPKGDAVSYPVGRCIAEGLYSIFEMYSSAAGELDKDLSVPVLSPAFVLRHLEDNKELFSAGLEKKHSGIANKCANAFHNWFITWRTRFVLEGIVTPDDAAAAFETLSKINSKNGDIPPFCFDFKKDGLRDRFDAEGLVFAPSRVSLTKDNPAFENAVPAENRSMDDAPPAGAQKDADAPRPVDNSAPPNQDNSETVMDAAAYAASCGEAMRACFGTDNLDEIKSPDIPSEPDKNPPHASQVPAESSKTAHPGDEKLAEKPAESRGSATRAGGQAVRTPDIEKAAAIANEVRRTEPAATASAGSTKAGQGSGDDLFDARLAGSTAADDRKGADGENEASDDGNVSSCENGEAGSVYRSILEEDASNVDLPCFDNLDFMGPESTVFNERGTIDLSGFSILDYGFFIPDLSDWWFRMLSACDTVCVEPAERDGASGLLFYCHGMTVPDGSAEPNKPFFISDSDMFRSIGYTGLYHRIFDLGNRTFYTFHKPEIVRRLRSKWSYTAGQLDGRIISMQPLLVCSYGSLYLADAEALASGSKNRGTLLNGNRTLNIFRAYPELYAESFDSLITNRPEYKKQVRWFQAYEYALGTAYEVSRFCNIEEPNLSRRNALDCRFRFTRKTRINYRCLLVGLKFKASKDDVPAEGDILKYLTALCIGRAFTVTQILGANPILLSFRPAEAVFLLPTFGDKQDKRMKERLLNAFAAFDNSFKATLRELGFKVSSLQNLYSFGAQILESEACREEDSGQFGNKVNGETISAGSVDPTESAAV